MKRTTSQREAKSEPSAKETEAAKRRKQSGAAKHKPQRRVIIAPTVPGGPDVTYSRVRHGRRDSAL